MMNQDETSRAAVAVMEFMLEHLDRMVADRVPSALVLAERIRAEKAAAWSEGHADGRDLVPNPYGADA